MYKDLLLSEGGGINVRIAQDDKNDISALIIGLGGTGGDTVKKIKKEVFKQIKPDRMEEDVPVYDSIRFLVVDSDPVPFRYEAYKSGCRIDDIDARTEFFDISCQNLRAVFPLLNKKEFAWFNSKEINSGQGAYGSGGIRQVGRLLFMLKAQDFYNRIQSEIHTLLQSNNANEINIYICTGISGGTGSGVFLDACYLIRDIMKSHFEQISYNILGYFFLPDVNCRKTGIYGNLSWEAALKRNGYCAMKELDYCMNFEYNRDRLRMDYGFRKIDTASKPVDLCYLVSTGVRSNLYEDTINRVAEYIIDSFRRTNVVAGNPGGMSTAVTMANSLVKNMMKMSRGAMPEYLTFGISAMKIPRTEIANYLGAKLFEKFQGIPGKYPTEDDVNKFLESNGLAYQMILDGLVRGCTSDFEFPMAYDWYLYRQNGTTPFVCYAEEQFLNVNKGKLEENYYILSKEIIDYSEGAYFDDSLIIRTFVALCEDCVKKVDYGPDFALALIESKEGVDLIHIVEGYIEKLHEEMVDIFDKYTLIREDLDNAVKALSNRPRRTNFKKWIVQMKRYYTAFYQLEVCKKMTDLLKVYRYQLFRLKVDYFERFDKVIQEMYETFQQNLEYLVAGKGSNFGYSGRIQNPNFISTLRSQLDASVSNVVVESAWGNFATTMMRESMPWMNGRTDKVAGMVSDFITGLFGSEISKGMNGYLSEMYGGITGHLLENEICKDIAGKMAPDSQNMLNMFNNCNAVLPKVVYITVPNRYEAIQAAGSCLGNNSNGVVKICASEDRIEYTELNLGIPMFAYQPLEDFEETYEKFGKPASCHLFESEELDWRTWLPSPIPYSYNRNDSESLRRKNQKLIEEFKEAEEAGVIIRDSKEDRWYILILRDDVADKGFAPAGDGTRKEQRVEELEVLDRMLHEREKLEIPTGRIADGYEETVVQDFYLRSPVMQGIVQRELKKLEEINQRKEELRKE